MQRTIQHHTRFARPHLARMRALLPFLCSSALILTSILGLTGCSTSKEPVHLHNTNTPGLQEKPFRLAEREWGKPDDRLTLALYTSSDHIVYFWCVRVIVLEQGQDGTFRIPNQEIPVPRFQRQRRPIVFVCDAEGRWGLYHHESEQRDLDCLLLERAPRLVLDHTELTRPENGVPNPADSADEALASLACHVLSVHDPDRRLDGYSTLRMSREDASRISKFLDKNPSTFSQTTQRLWRRLANHYDIRAVPNEGEKWSWAAIRSLYQWGPPTDKDLVKILPEREQRLTRGSYTAPDKPFDPAEEFRRRILESNESRVTPSNLEKEKSSLDGVSQ